MKKWLLYCGIILFIGILAIDLYTDLKVGENVNHKRGLVIRSIAMLLPAICFVYYKTNKFPRILLVGLVVITMMAANFSNLFDGFYNVFRGHGWFFTGSEDGAGDAVSDNFYQSIPTWLHALIKVGGSISSIIIYWKLKKSFINT